MDFIIGLVLGALVVGIVIYFFRKSFIKNTAESQSVILLEKIRSVSKMITVEGDFSEIMHFEDVKERFLSLISSKKKAIVLTNAKVLVGFDMQKIEFQSVPEQKKLVLKSFPEPEVLSIETDIQYYDVKNGMFNKFEASDLSELNKKVRSNIEDKIPESELLISAKSKALDTINMIEQLVSTFGWKFDCLQLQIVREEVKKIK